MDAPFLILMMGFVLLAILWSYERGRREERRTKSTPKRIVPPPPVTFRLEAEPAVPMVTVADANMAILAHRQEGFNEGAQVASEAAFCRATKVNAN